MKKLFLSVLLSVLFVIPVKAADSIQVIQDNPLRYYPHVTTWETVQDHRELYSTEDLYSITLKATKIRWEKGYSIITLISQDGISYTIITGGLDDPEINCTYKTVLYRNKTGSAYTDIPVHITEMGKYNTF